MSSQRMEPPAATPCETGREKMTVPRTLSDTSMSRPASRDGNEKSICRIVKRTNHVNMGIFLQVIPGARMYTMVSRMLTLPIVIETTSMISPRKASVGPGPGV